MPNSASANGASRRGAPGLSFRARLFYSLTVLLVVTLGGAFASVHTVVSRSEMRKFDEELLVEAHEEAVGRALLHDEHAERVDDILGPGESIAEEKLVFVFGKDASLHAANGSAKACTPLVETVFAHERREPFDVAICGRRMRAVFVGFQAHAGDRLLLARPREELDRDARYLAQTMLILLACAIALAAVTAWLVVRALTRDTERIGEITHRVQSGDLSARVASRSNIPELRRLADDVDGMIARLAALVVSQERFIAHAAHELRSPLTTLYGELSLALRKPRTAEEYREFIDEALASSRRLKALAEDLLALARIGADATGDILLLPVTIRALVANVLNDLRASITAKGITIDVALPDASIIARERDLERLFRNLLENALRHTPEGGTIRVGGEVRGETVIVTVEDSGEGVPETERERIFEPFYRGAKTRGEEMTGTGLGLAIVREIARVHGGEVSVSAARPFANSAGGGACFQVSLPAAEQ